MEPRDVQIKIFQQSIINATRQIIGALLAALLDNTVILMAFMPAALHDAGKPAEIWPRGWHNRDILMAPPKTRQLEKISDQLILTGAPVLHSLIFKVLRNTMPIC